MTKAVTTEEEDHNPLTPETFSFFDVLEGIEYPTDTVELFTAEKAQYQLNKTLTEIERSDPEGEGFTDLVDRASELHDKVQASKHTFYIQGVEDDEITALREVAEAHFEGKKVKSKLADGRTEKRLPESEQLNYAKYFTALIMSVHVTKVETADGRVMTAPGPDEIAHFLAKAPTSQKEKLQLAINELRVRASDFEASVDADFLAKR